VAALVGTDEFGRDVLSRAMAGGRIGVGIALPPCFARCRGALVGMLAGFMRGWTDRILMTINDGVLAFPGMLLALWFHAVFAGGERAIVLALSVAYLPSVVRVVRAVVLLDPGAGIRRSVAPSWATLTFSPCAPRGSQRSAGRSPCRD